MPTVREVLNARKQRLQQKRAQAVLLAQTCQNEIDTINTELAGLTQADEDRFVRLQALMVIQAEDR